MRRQLHNPLLSPNIIVESKWVTGQSLMFDCRLEKALGNGPLSFISCFQFL